MHEVFLNLFLVLGLLFLTACQPSNPETEILAPPNLESIRQELRASVEAGDIPSLSVAVAVDGEIVWMEGIGMADRQSAIPATPETIYAIGSTAKSMTGTLALALSERNLVDLETPIDAYREDGGLSLAKRGERYPNILELLSMTGGIPHGGGVIGRPDYNESRIVLLSRTAVAAYPPGVHYEYSNYSIGLAMAAMEAATDTPFDQLMQEYVFAPLDMRDSHVSYDMDAANLADLYGSSGDRIDHYRFFPEAAGGYYSSIRDMIRFALFHTGAFVPEEPVVSAAGLEMIHKTRPHDLGGAIFALGMGSIEYENLETSQVLSNGSVSGGNSHLSLFEGRDIVVVTALNQTSSESLADFTAMRIADVLIPGLMDNFGAAVGAYEGQRTQQFTGDENLNGVWRGIVETVGFSRAIEITIQDEEVSFVFEGNEPRLATGLTKPFGAFVAGSVQGIELGDGLWGEVGSGAYAFNLQRVGDSLFGHIIVRISHGTISGSYPLRLALEQMG